MDRFALYSFAEIFGAYRVLPPLFIAPGRATPPGNTCCIAVQFENFRTVGLAAPEAP